MFTTKKLRKRAKNFKTQMTKIIKKPQGTLSDYTKVLQAKQQNDFTDVFQTKLYQQHSKEYCILLELLIHEET